MRPQADRGLPFLNVQVGLLGDQTSVLALQQVRQLGDVDGNPSCLVRRQHLGLHRFGFVRSAVEVGEAPLIKAPDGSHPGLISAIFAT